MPPSAEELEGQTKETQVLVEGRRQVFAEALYTIGRSSYPGVKQYGGAVPVQLQNVAYSPKRLHLQLQNRYVSGELPSEQLEC